MMVSKISPEVCYLVYGHTKIGFATVQKQCMAIISPHYIISQADSWPPNLVFWVVLFFGNEKIEWIWPSMRPIRLVDDLLDTFYILFVFSQGFEIVQWQWMAFIAL